MKTATRTSTSIVLRFSLASKWVFTVVFDAAVVADASSSFLTRRAVFVLKRWSDSSSCSRLRTS
jgi:hypothetical protein